jgi:hypothetical protein
MKAHRALGAVLLLLLACGCAARRNTHPNQEMSGFLDDYSFLREGVPGDVALVYRNPNADWSRYDKVLLEPVTLWRSGRHSLDPVPQDDLLRLVSIFEDALRRQLGAGFRLVDQAGPGVMRIRLAITEARASDPILDVLRARSTPLPPPPGGPIDPELRRFIEGAAIEGEIRDAQTGELLAAGVDRRRREGALPIDTWAAIQRALDAWTERLCARLERRTQPQQQR